MNPKELFAKAIQQATSCVRNVTPDEMANPTPCTEWDLRALLNHMVYELLWVPEILRGKTIAEIGSQFDGDVLRSEPKTSWQHAADTALVAVHGADLDQKVHLSYGDVTAEHYINEISSDIFIHTWDLAQAIKCTLIMDAAVTKTVYEFLLPRAEELKNSALFGEPIKVPADADLQTKLLGLTGRSADKWLGRLS
jgi:uncharacterized protein (TIGR03086 family)